MNRLALAAVLLAGTAFATLPAKADTYQMDSFTVAPGAQAVAITSPINSTVLAGQIVLHSAVNGDLTVWCLDLTTSWSNPTRSKSRSTLLVICPGLPAGGLSLSKSDRLPADGVWSDG